MTDYNVQFPDGTPLVIQTGTINNTYDIPLVGQDAINYGDDFATAYIRLLSNFANTSAPSSGTTRTAGQLWYDTTPITGGLNIYDGTGWDAVPIDSNVVHIAGAELITGLKTFSAAADFTNAGSPFTVNSTTLVTNLNAQLLNGSADTAFASAAQGVLADAAEPDLGLPATSGWVLASTTGGVRSWTSLAAGTGNVDPQDVSGFISPASTSLLLTDDPTGDQQPGTDSDLTYNATSNILSCPTFLGNLTGNASTATLATTSTTATTATQVTIDTVDGDSGDTAMYPVMVAVNTATDQNPHTDVGGLTYNASTNTLTTGVFSGSGSGLVSLNASNVSSGVLAVARGGTGVTTSTGSGSAFVLSTSPAFTTSILVDLIDGNAGNNVTLQWSGASKFQTQDETANDQTSGAEVRDGNGDYRNVGFNDMITTSLGSSGTQNLTRANAGHSWRATNASGARTFQAEGTDSDIPNGAIWNLRNLTTSTGTVVIDAGASSTIRHYDGSGGTPPVDVNGANPFTLARGGVASIVKIADAEYEMWGIGLTGGA